MPIVFAEIFILVSVLYSFFITGRVLLKTPFLSTGTLAENSFLIPFVSGTVFWIYFIFILASLKMLFAIPVYGMISLVFLLGVISKTNFIPFSRMNNPGILEALFHVFLTVIAFSLLMGTFTPHIFWDEGAYHLTLPRLYLDQKGFFRVPFNVYSNWPQSMEMLFTLALLIKDFILARLIHFSFGILTLILIITFSRSRSDSRVAGCLAAIFFLANEIVLFEMKTAYADLGMAFFFFSAFVCLNLAFENPGQRKTYLIYSGLCLGLAAGTKFSGIFSLLCFVFLLLMNPINNKRKISDIWLLIFPGLILVMPWLIKSFCQTGNPLYPFFYSFFGGPEWSDSLSREWINWQQSIGMGRKWMDYLLLPVRVILSGGYGYSRFDGNISPFWIALVPLSIVFSFRNPLIKRCMTVSGIYFLLWSISSQQMRFLIPILPFLAVAGSLSVMELFAKVNNLVYRDFFLRGALLAAVIYMMVSFIPIGESVVSRINELCQNKEKITEMEPAVFYYINKRIPDDARILFLNTNQGFFCNRDFIADSFFEASQINALLSQAKTSQELQAVLQSMKMSHILFYRKNWGILYPDSLADLLQDTSKTRFLFTSGKYALFELI
ncbi:MAG: phospholipid carrier-dependent glycosyltransferase [Candidatus Aureabacteria bacterium]|nr:phospholipid carrier-dependent glycosyltransferase [Candidatus Auribacterota bacterium]